MAVSSLPTSSGPFTGNPNGSVQIDSGGNARGVRAVDFQSIRDVSTQVSSGLGSALVAAKSSTASSTYSVVMRGSECVASAWGAFASGSVSTASGRYSQAEGYICIASGNASRAFGYRCQATAISSTSSGYQCVASGQYATASGYYCEASGWYSTASGYRTSASGYYGFATGRGTFANGRSSTASGQYNTAESDYSTASGFYSKTSQLGQWAVAAGAFANQRGECQASTYIMRVVTVDTDPTKPLTFDNMNLRWFLEDRKFYAFTIQIMGAAEDGSDAAYFTRRGMVSQIDSVTTVYGTIDTVGTDIKSAGASAWDVEIPLISDDTLEINVTGSDAKNVRWIGRIDTAEIGLPPPPE